jgi:hypothetical protein
MDIAHRRFPGYATWGSYSRYSIASNEHCTGRAITDGMRFKDTASIVIDEGINWQEV